MNIQDHGSYDGGEYIYADDMYFQYRVLGSQTQVGVKDSFDRWANSVDFVFKTPRSVWEWESKFKILMGELKTHTNKSFGLEKMI